ncbi:MAG TPA: TMEM165/GDT1 family protein [Kribbellaceae bacterium]|nr:TMEM165/GDT1 family protein [Kribbellaceae bacterium]
MEWLAVAATAFALIVPVELPDKTFVATLLLATRHPPWPVWIGVTAAFGVQCMVAVVAGRLIRLLPETPVKLFAAGLFAVGAVVLLRQARSSSMRPPEYAQQLDEPGRGGWRAVVSSFLVLFAAEWGDLSQLLTAGLVAGGRPAGPVFVGSWVGLAMIAGAAVLLGQLLLRYVRVAAVRYVAAVICAVLAVLTAWNALQPLRGR